MKYLLLLLANSLFISCQEKNPEFIKIQGLIVYPKINKIYFTDAYNWKIPLDSATVKNGLFTLSIERYKLHNTIYSICFVDSNGRTKKMEYTNHVLSPDSIKYLIDAFVIDTPYITISPNKHNNEYYDIIAGKENDAYLSTQMINFGYVTGDISQRSNQITEYLGIIKKYPTSQFLLSKINENKSILSRTELSVLLNQFDKIILNGVLGIQLLTYVNNKVDKPIFKDFILTDLNLKNQNLLKQNCKIQMLIFWASWCSPCIREIPVIAKLNDLYSKKGLVVTSISIDQDFDKWKTALSQNRMNWNQLIVPEKLVADFSNIYELSSIPYVLFLDKSGKLINRFVGYEKNNLQEYIDIIEKNL